MGCPFFLSRICDKDSCHSLGSGVLAIILPLGLFAQDGLVSPNRVVIQGGTLISGTGEAPVPNAVIVIEGNRITAVGTAGSVSHPFRC